MSTHKSKINSAETWDDYVGQSTNSTSSNSTNSTIRVCNGTVLVITLPTNGYPWFFGYPPVGGGGPQFGHKHGGRGRG
ncbi:Protein of unknown function [Gryllus bimaculatus]|nr:Protein of unknown function [Gryllus bimaculatus]